MGKVFNLKTFWIVYIIAVVAIFVMSVNAGRVYESVTEVLIIPKSDMAVKNSEQIIANLSQLPYTLAFYDRMVAENEDAANAAATELPDYKKKADWNSRLKIMRVGTSGIFKIMTTDQDRYQAEVLSSEAAKTLVSTVGLYYNIETDLDVRIIDPTITNYSAGAFDFVLFFESISAAFLGIFFIFFVSLTVFEEEAIPQIARSNFFAWPEKESATEFSIENAVEKVPTEVKKEWTLPVEEKPYTDFVNTTRTASAPANLPIAEDEIFSDKAGEEKSESEFDSGAPESNSDFT